MTSAYYHVCTWISVEAARLLRSHPKPGSRPGSLAASPRLLIHVSLPFRRRAAQQTPNWWEHIPAITARLPQTHQPAKFPRRQEVSGFRGFLPLSQAFGLLGSDTSKDPRSAFQGDSPGDSSYFSNLWRWIGPTPAGSQPLPVTTASGRTCSTTPESAETRDLEGLCEKKACLPVLKRTCGAHLRLILVVTQRRSASGSLLFTAGLQALAGSSFLVLYFCVFSLISLFHRALGTGRTASNALHFSPPGRCLIN